MVISFACQIVYSCVCCCMRLGNVIVKYCTCHFSCFYVVKSFGQSIYTYKVDIFANCTSCCFDRLQSTKCHSVVVTEYNFYVITKLA